LKHGCHGAKDAKKDQDTGHHERADDEPVVGEAHSCAKQKVDAKDKRTNAAKLQQTAELRVNDLRARSY